MSWVNLRVNIHAIEPTRSGEQRRVDGLKTPRHRVDAATERASRRWRGRLKFDFHTGLDLVVPGAVRHGQIGGVGLAAEGHAFDFY